MRYPDGHTTFNLLDRAVLSLIRAADVASENPDCFETTQPEALRFWADLLELRSQIMNLQEKYLGERRWTELSDETILKIVRHGEQV